MTKFKDINSVQIVGLVYIASSFLFAIAIVNFRDWIDINYEALLLLVPIVAWVIFAIFAVVITTGKWGEVTIWRDWRFVQLILAIAAGIINHAVLYSLFGISGPTGQPELFVDHLYFSIVTWTTLGYGDFQPANLTRLVAASEALLGYFNMGLFLGVFLNAGMKNNSK